MKVVLRMENQEEGTVINVSAFEPLGTYIQIFNLDKLAHEEIQINSNGDFNYLGEMFEFCCCYEG